MKWGDRYFPLGHENRLTYRLQLMNDSKKSILAYTQTVIERISNYICGEMNEPPIGDKTEMETEK